MTVYVEAIKKLFRYIQHKWLQNVRDQRLSVVGIPERTNNGDILITRHLYFTVISRHFCYLTFPVCRRFRYLAYKVNDHYFTFQLLSLFSIYRHFYYSAFRCYR